MANQNAKLPDYIVFRRDIGGSPTWGVINMGQVAAEGFSSHEEADGFVRFMRSVDTGRDDDAICFRTRELAQAAADKFIGLNFPNKFQDARSIARIKIVEFGNYFCVQFGDYGEYLTHSAAPDQQFV